MRAKIWLSLLGIILMSFLVAGHAQAASNLNNFEISSYDMKLELSRDQDQRSVLETTESIVAEFPNNSVNHGIERYIPVQYDGHSVSLYVESVTDQTGNPQNFTTYESGDFMVVRIGNANSYVSGTQHYNLKYRQRDVTKFFSNTNRQEFYWDTNGTDWKVPIHNFSATLTIDKSLQQAVSTDVNCYAGQFGSTNQCQTTKGEGTYRATADTLMPGENVTFSIGFGAETFAAYKSSLMDGLITLWLIGGFISFLPLLGLIIFLSVRAWRWSNRSSEVKPITVEFIPPPDSSVSMSAVVMHQMPMFSAQLIDLAVRHYVKLYEVKQRTTFVPGVYEIEVVKAVDSLRAEEQEFLSDIFDGTPAVGSRVSTDTLTRNLAFAMRLNDNSSKIDKMLRGDYGMKEIDPIKRRWFRKRAHIMLVFGILLLSPLLLIAAVIAYILSATLWVRTDKGLALYRYLLGLRQYIAAVEIEQFRLLQSPDGADKVSVDPNDPKQLVKLYERNLSYAVLFGLEKKWNGQLGKYYETDGSQPDWYVGSSLGAFNALAFTSSMNDLTTSISSVGASSSSSGGSSGGGSSGGGGGGGGGGGW